MGEECLILSLSLVEFEKHQIHQVAWHLALWGEDQRRWIYSPEKEEEGEMGAHLWIVAFRLPL